VKFSTSHHIPPFHILLKLSLISLISVLCNLSCQSVVVYEQEAVNEERGTSALHVINVSISHLYNVVCKLYNF
jgi:hypothetical protein